MAKTTKSKTQVVNKQKQNYHSFIIINNFYFTFIWLQVGICAYKVRKGLNENLPIFSKALHGLFRVHLSLDGADDHEIKKESGKRKLKMTLLLAGEGRRRNRRTDMMKKSGHHHSRRKKVLFDSISFPVSFFFFFLNQNPNNSQLVGRAHGKESSPLHWMSVVFVEHKENDLMECWVADSQRPNNA